jgi:hypothetical protein
VIATADEPDHGVHRRLVRPRLALESSSRCCAPGPQTRWGPGSMREAEISPPSPSWCPHEPSPTSWGSQEKTSSASGPGP